MEGEAPGPESTSSTVVVIPLGFSLAPGQDLGAVLEAAAGTRVRRLGGIGSFTALSVRGSSFRQVEYFLDGLPLNPDGGSVVDLSEFPVEAFQQVELYRGASPVRFGSAAMGGVVNLVSAAEIPTSIQVGGGSFGTFSSSALVAPRYGPFSLILSAHQLHTEGNWLYFENQGTEFNLRDDRTLVREHNKLDRGSVFGRTRLELGNLELALLENWSTSHQELSGPVAAEIKQAQLESQRNLLALQLDLKGRVRLEPSLWWSWRQDVLDDRAGEIGVGAQWTEDTTQTAGFSIGARTLWEKPTLILGEALVRGRVEQFHPYDRLNEKEDGSRYRLGLSGAVGGEIQLFHDWLTLSPALIATLLDNRFLGEVPFKNMPVAPEGNALDFMLAPRAGLLLRPLPALALKASAGRYLRPPDLSELFGDSGYTVGNTELLPEEGFLWEGGFRLVYCGSLWGMALEGSWAENRADNLIVYVQNSQLTSRAENVGKAWIRAVEGTLSFSLLQTVELSTALTSLTSRNLVADPTYANNTLPGIAPLELASALSLHYRFISTTWDLSYLGPTWLDTANVQQTAPRLLVGSSLALQPSPSLSLQAQVLNLLDTIGMVVPRDPLHPESGQMVQPMTDFAGYPLPGRTILISLTWKEQ